VDTILVFVKKLIPRKLFLFFQPSYHLLFNYLAAAFYRFPSEKVIVVGVTGTTGKTTVTYMIAKMLEGSGMKVGYTSTAMFGDGQREWLNDKKMTMLGRFFTQRMLRTMVDNGCEVVIVETTSEGAVQFRHRFINYDIFVFTGLYPEHIESHGSFENYKNAKLSLFAHISSAEKKLGIDIPKTIIVNGDDEHAKDFLAFDRVKKVVFTAHNQKFKDKEIEYVHYSMLGSSARGVLFGFDTTDIQLKLLGDFTPLNASASGSVGRALGLSSSKIKKGLESIEGIPGRLERISLGQDFGVIVDYAFEPVAVTKLYETISVLEPQRIIHVLGSAGGGRDTSRRKVLGEIAGRQAQIVIVTNEDPYDEDPLVIMAGVASGAREAGKQEGKDLFLLLDRKQAIAKALRSARSGDVVLITGKGSEQAIVVKDEQKIPWDDREVVRAILKSM